MTPLIQTILHDEEKGHVGDCWRTCVAMILDMEPEKVPHFVELHGDSAVEKTIEWLQDEHGLSMLAIYPFDGPKETSWIAEKAPVILSGNGPRGRRHSVVAYDGTFYDPHPSGDGIKKADVIWAIVHGAV